MAGETQVYQDKLSKVITKLLFTEPFYGHLFVGMCRVFDPRLRNYWGQPSACGVGVSSTRVVLIVNPDFFFSFTPEDMEGILRHEAVHLVLKHISRGRRYSDKARLNVAADLAANTVLGKKKVPKGSLFPEQFDLSSGETLEYYYSNLPRPKEENPIGAEANGLVESVGGSEESAEDREELSEEKDFPPPWLPEGCTVIDSHDWEVEEVIAEFVIDSMVERSKLKTHGDLPAEIKDLIEYRGMFYIPWQRVLRRFLGTSRANLAWTKKRPSKRFESYPGVRMDNRSTLLIAVDSSGSIENHELDAFMTEVAAAYETGLSDIWVVTCDAKIHEVIHPFRKVDMVSGRGGTDFRPPFRWALDTTLHPPMDGVVYLTDGDGTYSEKQSIPTLWVCTHDGAISCGWGSILRLPDLRKKELERRR